MNRTILPPLLSQQKTDPFAQVGVAKHYKSLVRIFRQSNNAVFFFKLSDSLFHELFQLLVFGSTLKFRNITDLVQQDLRNSESITRQAVFHRSPLTKY